jgi:hypothetical protein
MIGRTRPAARQPLASTHTTVRTKAAVDDGRLRKALATQYEWGADLQRDSRTTPAIARAIGVDAAEQ